MNMYGGVEVQIHAFLTSALDVGLHEQTCKSPDLQFEQRRIIEAALTESISQS
jgi:hypothetical protein